MSNFSRRPGADRAPSVKVEVDGTFLCQFCGESVESAFYLPEDNVLVWKCPEEHISSIEKFTL